MEGNALGVVLVGTGSIAPKHARAVAATEGLRLVAVVSRDRRRAAALAERFGAAGTDDLEDALARDDADLLAVATEHDRHVPLLHAAAAAGRPVLVEKPIAVDLAEGARALAACEAAGVPVGCVFQRRFDPALVRLRAAVDAGRTGAPIAVELSMVWRRDARYFAGGGGGGADGPTAWRGDPERAGGGVAMMQAIHLLDAARWLVGEVVEVDGAVGRARAHAAVEDVAAATLRFEVDALGAVLCTTAAAGALANRAAFHFERGSVVIEAEHPRVWTIPDGQETAPSGWTTRLRRGVARRLPWRLVPRGAGPKGRFADVYADFRDAVRTGRSPRSSGRDALRSVAVVDALYRAAREGRRVAVHDPNGES